LTDERFSYSICNDCRVYFCSDRPIEEDISLFYPLDYAPYTTVACNASDAQHSKSLIARYLHRQKRKSIKRYLEEPQAKLAEDIYGLYTDPEKGRLIDFGCGSAVFLNYARENGWNTTGVDFNLKTIDDVKANGHVGFVFTDDSSLDGIADDSADVIRLNHVLEHLYQPEHVLRLLIRKLKPGGTMRIAVPNPAGISATEFGAHWKGLDCPRHVILYPPDTLVAFLRKLGVGDISVVHESGPRDYVISECVREVVREGRLGEVPTEAAADDKHLMLAAARKTVSAAAAGCGDRIHVTATKTI